MATDIEARQLALQYIDRAAKAETASKVLLKQAQQANMDFARNQSDAAAARRAVLAQQAYTHRMSAELGRTMAAYALLAEKEGARALTAREALSRVQDSRQREVLIEEVKGGELRRNIMLQAASAATKALSVAPGLAVPPGAGASQSTPGNTGVFRAQYVEKLKGQFYPSDIRVASSALAGLSGDEWMSSLLESIERDAKAVSQKANELASEASAQEPGAAGLSQQADGVINQLKRRAMAEHNWSRPPSMPLLHMAVAGVGVLLLTRLFR